MIDVSGTVELDMLKSFLRTLKPLLKQSKLKVGYLNKKKGFILVSHDRDFLDQVVDHIISINHTNIDIQKGNFSSWQENKDKQDNFEIMQDEKLRKVIKKLEVASKNTSNWSDKIEKSKYILLVR